MRPEYEKPMVSRYLCAVRIAFFWEVLSSSLMGSRERTSPHVAQVRFFSPGVTLPSRLTTGSFTVAHSPSICSVFGIPDSMVSLHRMQIPCFDPVSVQLGSLSVVHSATSCPRGLPSVALQRSHVLGWVHVASFQSWPKESPSVASHFVHVLGCVQVASFHSWLQGRSAAMRMKMAIAATVPAISFFCFGDRVPFLGDCGPFISGGGWALRWACPWRFLS